MTGNAAAASSAGRALLVLAFANFVVGMGAFTAIGVLTPFAAAFEVDKPTAGWLMTSYALVYAVASPLLVSITGAMDRRRVLLASMALFAIGAVMVAFAPNFSSVMLGRAVMAFGGGLSTPVSAVVGVALAGPEARGRALATVFGGLTLSQVLGVPAGAWLGYAFGWQSAFLVVAALCCVSLVAMARVIPSGIASPRTSLATLGAVLMDARLVLAVSFTAFFLGGVYVLYTYTTPFLEARLGLGRDGVTAMLVLAGLGAVIGNGIGGFLADRMRPAKALIGLCLAQIALMPLISLTHLSLIPLAAIMFVWSVVGWSFMVLQQTRLTMLDPPRTPVLFALNAASIYIGGSIGSLVGGRILGVGGFDWLGPGGAVIVLLALASLWAVARLSRRAP